MDKFGPTDLLPRLEGIAPRVSVGISSQPPTCSAILSKQYALGFIQLIGLKIERDLPNRSNRRVRE